MTGLSSPDPRLFGRRKGRPLHKRKTALMTDLLPKFELRLDDETVQKTLQSKNISSLLPSEPKQIWLEIGFGGGEHLAAEAALHPTIGFIGCEPFLNGVAGLLDHIDQKQLTNIRIFTDDARLLLDCLPSSSIARCSVLYADPWPKARHAERRFIGDANLKRLGRVLVPTAPLRLATDDGQLADWMRFHLKAAVDFDIVWDSCEPLADWIPTRYEEKGRAAGRQPHYIEARRR